MLAKIFRIMRAIYARQTFFGDPITVGEIERSTKIPYSTVRRYLQKAIVTGYVETEFRPYKATGEHVYWLTEAGENAVLGLKELI